jgi:hypothetical protein
MRTDPMRYGAYFCLSDLDAVDVPALAERLGLVNDQATLQTTACAAPRSSSTSPHPSPGPWTSSAPP